MTLEEAIKTAIGSISKSLIWNDDRQETGH